jgi:hypothetical protein
VTTFPASSKMPKAVLPNGVVAAGAFLIPCLLCIPRNGVVQIVVLLLAAAGALWVGHHHAIVERYLRKNSRQRWALILGCSFLLSALAIGDLVSARWWVMDDHELASILGSDHQLGFAEMVQSLREHPEVGNLGEFSRVRPTYYIIRHLEAFLWGENLALWYAARVIALGGVFALCWHLLWRWVGGIDAGLLMLMIFCWRMWGDLWSRIGSSETYAMVGIALSVLGVVMSERFASVSRWKNATAWLLIAMGAVISMGCKENFLILAPAVMGYAGWLWYRRKMTVSAITGTLAVASFAVFIALAVVGSLAAEGGVDIYANQRSVSTLMWATIRCLTAHFGAIMLLAIIGLIVFARRIQADERLSRLLPQTTATIWVLAALLALFVSQFAFYDDFNTFSGRYAFPAALAPLLMLPLVVRLRVRYRRIIGEDRQRIRRSVFAMRFAMVLLVGGMGLVMQRHATRHVRQTTAFTNEVLRIATACEAEPETPLVFVSHRPIDYETLYSVASFLRYYSVSNPIYLQLEGYGQETYPRGLQRALAEELQNASVRGDETFRPINELQLDKESIGIGFSEKPAKIACLAEFPCWK